jgi:hypothetical protein
MLLGGLAALWLTHTIVLNLVTLLHTLEYGPIREYGLTCNVPLYKSKLLHQMGYGARALDSVNFRKFRVRGLDSLPSNELYPPRQSSTYKSAILAEYWRSEVAKFTLAQWRSI